MLTANSVGGFIERMWAYRTIKKYGEQRSIEADGVEQTNAIDRNILRIALKVLLYLNRLPFLCVSVWICDRINVDYRRIEQCWW